MSFKLTPRPLHTTILHIEFLRQETKSGPLASGPWYRIDITVNGEPYSCEVLLLTPRGFGFHGRPNVFGALKYPVSVLEGHVRRFAEGDFFSFPIDLGDIGKV